MEEFDNVEYRKAQLRLQEAIKEMGEAVKQIAEKIVETFNSMDWDSVYRELKEGQEDVLEDYIRSRQRRHVRDSVRYRGGRRPSGRCRDWRRAELPAQKSYVRRWKFRASRPRRDFRRRR
jgi:hypothetical protein